MHQWFEIFGLVKEKIKQKVSACFFENTSVWKATSEFLFRHSFAVIGRFSPVFT
jgi:hypothetical protein